MAYISWSDVTSLFELLKRNEKDVSKHKLIEVLCSNQKAHISDFLRTNVQLFIMGRASRMSMIGCKVSDLI